MEAVSGRCAVVSHWQQRTNWTTLLIPLLALFTGLWHVAAVDIREAPRVQLASELNIGFELVSRCTSSFTNEAGFLCEDRKAFTLYGHASSGCQQYFWCSPQHGACIMKCAAGQLFNKACNCCQDVSTTSYDTSMCSGVVITPTNSVNRQQQFEQAQVQQQEQFKQGQQPDLHQDNQQNQQVDTAEQQYKDLGQTAIQQQPPEQQVQQEGQQQPRAVRDDASTEGNLAQTAMAEQAAEGSSVNEEESSTNDDSSTTTNAIPGRRLLAEPQHVSHWPPYTLGSSSSSADSSSDDSKQQQQQHRQQQTRARRAANRQKRRQATAAALAAEDDSPAESLSSLDPVAAAVVAAAAAADGITNAQDPQHKAGRRQGDQLSRWNRYGKRYSRGKWAKRQAVKEPAVRGPASATTLEFSSVPIKISGLLDAVQQVIGSAAAAAGGEEAGVPAAAVSAQATSSEGADRGLSGQVAVAAAGTVPDVNSDEHDVQQVQRLLLDTTTQPDGPVAATAAAGVTSQARQGARAKRRSMHVKRTNHPRVAAAAAASGAAAATATGATAGSKAPEPSGQLNTAHRHAHGPLKVRPMAKKPAAKAVDPADEQAAPFADAVGTKQSAASAATAVSTASDNDGNNADSTTTSRQHARPVAWRSRLAHRMTPHAQYEGASDDSVQAGYPQRLLGLQHTRGSTTGGLPNKPATTAATSGADAART